jgi:hypothetical protein
MLNNRKSGLVCYLRAPKSLLCIVFFFYLLFFMISIPHGIAATSWIKTYGETTRSESAKLVIQTADGGFAIVGTADDSFGHSDAYLVKTDSSGNLQWSQTYGGSEGDSGNSIMQTSEGGFVIAGTRNEWSSNGSDVWLFKTDTSGKLLWEQTYSGSAKLAEYGYSVVQTEDGGYLVLGDLYWGSPTGGPSLIKTDSSGNIQWNRTISENNYCYSLIQTSDGGFASAGSISDDLALIKIDSSGIVRWNQTYTDERSTNAFSLIQTADGGYALAGDRGGTGTSLDQQHQDFVLVKTDSAGKMQWLKTYGVIDYEIAFSIVQTKDGGYAVAGISTVEDRSKLVNRNDYNTNWVVKTDSSGNMQWNKTYGNPDTWEKAHSVILTTDGGLVIVGEIQAQSGERLSDFWLVKTDENGNAPSDQTLPTSTVTSSPTVGSTTPNETSVPSPSVPEFPSGIIIIVLAVVLVSTIILKKKQRTKF